MVLPLFVLHRIVVILCMSLSISGVLVLPAAFGSTHWRLWIVPLRLWLRLFAHNTLIMSSSACSAHLDWVVLLIWIILRGLIWLKYVGCSRPLQLAITHILGLSLTCSISVSCQKRWVLSKDLLEVKSGGRSSLLFLHLCVVKFDEWLKFTNNVRPIVRMISTWVVW